jgi:hypothetical protein
MHTVRRYATECCHCTCCWYQQRFHLWSILTDAFLLVSHRDTLDFMQPHIKKSNGFQSCDHAGQATGLLPIHLPLKFSLKKTPLPLYRNVEVPLHLAVTFITLNEARHLNTDEVHFPENVCTMELLKSLSNTYVVLSGYCLMLKHHTFSEYRC